MIRATRRSFLALLGTATAGIAAPGARPAARFPSDPRARIAVATYPFRAYLDAPGNTDRDPSKHGMDLAAFAHSLRHEFQVSGIEPLHSHFPGTDEGSIIALRDSFRSTGVRTVNIPVDAPVDLCSEDEAKRAAGNATYRRWIDIAITLGSPSIRVWIPKCTDVTDLGKAVHALRPTLHYAASRGIVVNLENDDPVLSSHVRVLAAIRMAGSRYLRALPDFANSLMGGDAAFNARAVAAMFAQAWNIAHVKDAEVIHGKRETVSLPHLFALARQAGYRGYYSMESDSEQDPYADTKHLIEQTLRLM